MTTILIIAISFVILAALYNAMVEKCECGGTYSETGYPHIGTCDRCGNEKVFME